MFLNTATRQPDLQDRFVEAVQRQVESRPKRPSWSQRRALRHKAAKTAMWLREIESKEAAPVMRAIAKAEKVAGHRLALPIDNDLILCSRGFRIPASCMVPPEICFPEFTTFQMRPRNIVRRPELLSRGKLVKDYVIAALQKPNIENKLVYQGNDEWPVAAQICWYGAMIATAFLPWPMIVYHFQYKEFERAFRPVEAL